VTTAIPKAKTTTPETAARPAPEELRARIESALKDLRDAVSDLPDRLRTEATDMERTFGKAGDDALREVARYAIRAQRDPAALKELAAEVRKRKAELAS
jgi:hypothetical protein